MKFTVELSAQPKKGDMLIFDGKGFAPISPKVLLSDTQVNINDINKILNGIDEKIKNIENDIKILKGED